MIRYCNHDSSADDVAQCDESQIVEGSADGYRLVHNPLVKDQDGVWRIVDLHSTNGTLVNDMDVREATLHEGDLVTIGLVNLEFRAG